MDHVAPPPPAPLPLGRPVRRRIGRRLVGVAVLAVIGLWLAVHEHVERYRVTSASMEPTLQVGEHVTADTSSSPGVGDIVVFHPSAGARPRDPVCGSAVQGAGSTQACDVPVSQKSSAIFVKRVVAGPGDVISIVDGRVVRNGATQPEPYIAPCSGESTCSFPDPITVPAGDYYVLGDNRGLSDDSRFWGPVPRAWILGRVVHCSLLDIVCHPSR